MNKRHAMLLSAPALVLALSVYAADPAGQPKEAAEPDCAALKQMRQADSPTMDPALKEMRKKCRQKMHAERMKGGATSGAETSGAKLEGGQMTEGGQMSEGGGLKVQ